MFAERIAQIQRLSAEERAELTQKLDAERRRAELQKVADLRREAGIPDRFSNARFFDLDRDPNNAEALDAAAAVIDGGFHAGLGLWGPVGVGKTTIAASIANAALASGVTVRFCSVAGFMDTLQEASRFSAVDDVSDLIARYASVQVLVLDDLGREPLTRRTLPWLYELLNQRWLKERPILLPTNYSFGSLTARYIDAAKRAGEDVSLAEAIVDRLADLCPQPWVKVGGISRRGAA